MTLSEDEIDLRPYVMALIHRRVQISLAAAVVALIVFVYLLQQPLTYKTKATLLLTRSRSDLLLAAQFPTVQEPLDLGTSIQTAQSLFNGESFAREVLDMLGDSLPPNYRSTGRLRNSIDIKNQGDLLFVEATADDPQTATLIANGYAELGKQIINRAYSEGQPLEEIQVQRQNAFSEYEKSQQALQNFMQNAEIAILRVQVDEAQNLVDILAKDVNTRIRYYSQRKRAMEELALEAQALREQIAAGGDSTAARLGDALAVLRLRAKTFDISAEGEPVIVKEGETAIQPPTHAEAFNFDLQLSEVENLTNPQNITRDLDRFITLAQQEAKAADAMLQESQGRLLDGGRSAILEGPTGNLQELKARLEEQEAREREWQSQRDIAWQAYQVIAQKETEIRSGPQTQQFVNIASPATVPEAPAPRNAVRNAVIAGSLTAILVSLWTLITKWWSSVRIPVQAVSQPTGSQASD